MKLLIDLFKKLFVARTDVYYLQTLSNDEKKKCTYLTVREKLTDEVIETHLNKSKTIGLVPFKDSTKWFVFDLDTPEKKVATLIREKCLGFNLPTYLFYSGGRGWHIYIFFEKPVPNVKARNFGKYILKECDLLYLLGKRNGIDIFPAQDYISDVGNCIKAPLSIHLASGNECFLADPDFQKVLDPFSVLSHVKLVTEETIDKINPHIETSIPHQSSVLILPKLWPACIENLCAIGANSGERNLYTRVIVNEGKNRDYTKDEIRQKLEIFYSNIKDKSDFLWGEIEVLLNNKKVYKPYGPNSKEKLKLCPNKESCQCAKDKGIPLTGNTRFNIGILREFGYLPILTKSEIVFFTFAIPELEYERYGTYLPGSVVIANTPKLERFSGCNRSTVFEALKGLHAKGLLRHYKPGKFDGLHRATEISRVALIPPLNDYCKLFLKTPKVKCPKNRTLL